MELESRHRGNEEPLEADTRISDLLEMLKSEKSKIKFE